MTPQETPDQSEIEKLIDPAAENYLPEQIQRELLRCAGSNGRISVDYLFAIYRCGQAAELAAHAAEVSRLTAERDEARAIVRALDAKHDDGCDVMAVIEYDFAAGTTTTRKPDPIPEWRRRP